MKKKLLIIITIFFLITLLGACDEEALEEELETEEITEEGEAEVIEADFGGTLRLAIPEMPNGNPFYKGSIEGMHLQQLIFESLVSFDEDFSIIGEIAKDWTFSDDGQVVELELHSDATWHDGEPLTTEDIVFTVETIKNIPKEKVSPRIYQNSVKHISDIRELENGNVQVSFTRPYSNAMETLTFPILPKHIFEGRPEALTGEDFPWIGSGVYKLKEMNVEEFTLQKVPEHYRLNPYIEKIHVRVVKDNIQRRELFKSGELDLYRNIYLDPSDLENMEDKKVHAFLSNHLEFVAFNFSTDSIAAGNRDFRRVLKQGIMKDQLIDEIYFGYALAAGTPIHQEHWLFNEDLKGQTEKLEEHEIQEIMEAEGFVYGEEGYWLDDNGVKLSLEILVNKSHRPRVMAAEVIKGQLQNLGFEIIIVEEELNRIDQRLQDGDYELYLGAWELAFLPDVSFAFHSNFVGESNFMNYGNEALDEVLEEVFRAKTQEEKKELFDELQSIIFEDLPVISLYFLQETYVSGTSLHGELNPISSNIFANIEQWFMETK